MENNRRPVVSCPNCGIVVAVLESGEDREEHCINCADEFSGIIEAIEPNGSDIRERWIYVRGGNSRYAGKRGVILAQDINGRITCESTWYDDTRLARALENAPTDPSWINSWSHMPQVGETL